MEFVFGSQCHSSFAQAVYGSCVHLLAEEQLVDEQSQNRVRVPLFFARSMARREIAVGVCGFETMDVSHGGRFVKLHNPHATLDNVP